MALSQFPSVMPSAVTAVLRAATALRYIRDTSGDLPFHRLNEAQDALRDAKVTTFAALSEGAKAPATSEAFMAGLGGPASLEDYQSAAMVIEAKASAWNALIDSTLASLPVRSVIGMVSVSLDGIVTKHVEHKSFIPADYAANLRSSQQLTDLIEAFEAVGA